MKKTKQEIEEYVCPPKYHIRKSIQFVHSSNLYMSITIYKKRITQSANAVLESGCPYCCLRAQTENEILNSCRDRLFCCAVFNPSKKKKKSAAVGQKNHPSDLYKGSSLIIQEEVNWYAYYTSVLDMKWFDDGSTSLPSVSALSSLALYIFFLLFHEKLSNM